MNLPDFTLLLQMIHFGIAYLILRRFVFEPALAIIEHQEQRHKQLEHKVQVAKEQYHQLLSQQTQRWTFIQQSLCGMIPNVAQKLCFGSTKLSAPVRAQNAALSDHEKTSIQSMLKSELLDVK